MNTNLTNWAGNYRYSAAEIHAPATVEQVQELLAGSRKVKALGTRHSFNDIADCTGDLLSLAHLDRVVELDRERGQVRVEGGIRYGELCRFLHDAGYALHNMASLPHISVAGACATATHGSGNRNGNLATAVVAIEVVTANGEITVFSRERNPEEFRGAVVGLGALGIVARLTLDLSPAFEMRQDVYQNLSLARLEDCFEPIVSGAYSVSLFTDWQEARFNQVWFKRRVDDDPAFEPEDEIFGATRALGQLHPLAGMPAMNCTEQMGVPGPWHERLPHFRMEFTPSCGEELQSEYVLPRTHAVKALHAVYELRDHIAPLLQISEVRTVAADEYWLSPYYHQDCVCIHFTWRPDWPAVQAVLPLIERALAPFEARPHWGKLFTMPAEQLQPLYERLPEFRQLVHRHDPDGKFRNSYLDAYIL
ncbi:MAG TPA: FAD-binding protein [Abditibacteriaceae bacterium]|jgi:xylitol oxidase